MITTYDSVLQTEEYLTPEEYLKRREKGEIDPTKIRYASHDPKTGASGGFWLKLDRSRYRTDLPPATADYFKQGIPGFIPFGK